MQDDFFASIPVFDSFENIVDPAFYRPLPEHWFIGFTDVVESAGAVAAGRYKAVNMAGVAAIAAVSNALDSKPFPFAFGGDGATLAVAQADEPRVRAALAATARWARDELKLELRAALVPVGDVRKAGHDVTAARYAPSPDVDYAMFAGGGVGWVERQAKAGLYAVEPAPPGVQPDLTGLSCRFGETPTRRGVIASVIVQPVGSDAGGEPGAFRKLILDILALTADPKRAGHPLPDTGPPFDWPPAGLDLEVSARASHGLPKLVERTGRLAYTFFVWTLFKLDLKLAGFQGSRYRRELAANADFRKFDDGLKLTLDCTPDLADELEAMLGKAEDEGLARYGMHRQAAALVTCISPVPTLAHHIHFVDGAGGGYTAASRGIKEVAGEPEPKRPGTIEAAQLDIERD
ncbi:MAG TPA: DUF3095 domain-containing protein [Aestuariivirgaceae bacterium]|nr:DUF3095 domain-containing protein [Aestuariivirgaceae bacterium]